MTPAGDQIEPGRRTPSSAGETRLTPEAARRAQHQRRRVTAAGALLLVIVWITSLASSGGAGKPNPHGSGAALGIGRATQTIAKAPATAASATTPREQQAIQSALSYTAYVTAGSAGKREIALTFDDGPGPMTGRILGTLKRYRAPATFFVVGSTLKDFGSYIPREIAGGFVIGDHTQNHRAMAGLSRKDQLAEVLDQAAAIRHLGASSPHLFRPPYGSFNATTLAITKKLKMLPILWSIDTEDFRRPGVAKIVQTVLSQAKPGAIVLMHDAGGPREQTAAALPVIIKALRKRHFELVTVPRLLADNPPLTAQQAPPQLRGG